MRWIEIFGFYPPHTVTSHIQRSEMKRTDTHRVGTGQLFVAKDKVFFLGTLQNSCIMNMQSWMEMMVNESDAKWKMSKKILQQENVEQPHAHKRQHLVRTFCIMNTNTCTNVTQMREKFIWRKTRKRIFLEKMLRQHDKRDRIVWKKWGSAVQCIRYSCVQWKKQLCCTMLFIKQNRTNKHCDTFTNCITSEKTSTHKNKVPAIFVAQWKSFFIIIIMLYWGVCVCIGWALSSILHRQRAETSESKCAKENRAIGNKENANGTEGRNRTNDRMNESDEKSVFQDESNNNVSSVFFQLNAAAAAVWACGNTLATMRAACLPRLM